MMGLSCLLSCPLDFLVLQNSTLPKYCELASDVLVKMPVQGRLKSLLILMTQNQHFWQNPKSSKTALFLRKSVYLPKNKQKKRTVRKLKERCERLRIETNEDYIIFRGECVVRSTIRDIINKNKIDSKNAATGGDDVSDNPDN